MIVFRFPQEPAVRDIGQRGPDRQGVGMSLKCCHYSYFKLTDDMFIIILHYIHRNEKDYFANFNYIHGNIRYYNLN